MKYCIPILISLTCIHILCGQQVADTSFKPPIPDPSYSLSQGPLVFIDEGHHNFHTKDGRYKSFANLLERDGYVVKSYKGKFEEKELAKSKVLVISNALNKQNLGAWHLPTPSAFSKKEIQIVEQWVRGGGSLFLIADHMPMAGAASDLAKAFGYTFSNGFVLDTVDRGAGIFRRQDESLMDNVITNGRSSSEEVNRIATFTGQAFQIPEEAEPILELGDQYINLLPDTAWVFHQHTKQLSAQGWYQGAYQSYGKGRLVVFGEAAMFSAQLAGAQKRKMGMNNPVAPENYQLLLNIIHWLDGKL